MGSAAVVGFFKRHVVGLETQLHFGDQQKCIQHMNPVQLEETKKVQSQYEYIRDEEGRLLRDIGHNCERWVIPLAAEREIRHAYSR